MKSVLISIQPKWCELIASGKKTNEVRKTRPKIGTPFKCYIYCTNNKDMLWVLQKNERTYTDKLTSIFDAKDVGGATKANGKVIGEFMCDKIYDVINFGMGIAFGENGRIVEPQEMLNKACLNETELEKYFELSGGYAWHISNLVIYDKPKELSEFRTHCKYEFTDDFEHCEGCQHYYYSNTPSCGIEEYCGCDGLKPLTRPPQSWCYVEEVK